MQKIIIPNYVMILRFKSGLFNYLINGIYNFFFDLDATSQFGRFIK